MAEKVDEEHSIHYKEHLAFENPLSKTAVNRVTRFRLLKKRKSIDRDCHGAETIQSSHMHMLGAIYKHAHSIKCSAHFVN